MSAVKQGEDYFLTVIRNQILLEALIVV